MVAPTNRRRSPSNARGPFFLVERQSLAADDLVHPSRWVGYDSDREENVEGPSVRHVFGGGDCERHDVTRPGKPGDPKPCGAEVEGWVGNPVGELVILPVFCRGDGQGNGAGRAAVDREGILVDPLAGRVWGEDLDVEGFALFQEPCRSRSIVDCRRLDVGVEDQESGGSEDLGLRKMPLCGQDTGRGQEYGQEERHGWGIDVGVPNL